MAKKGLGYFIGHTFEMYENDLLRVIFLSVQFSIKEEVTIADAWRCLHYVIDYIIRSCCTKWLLMVLFVETIINF